MIKAEELRIGNIIRFPFIDKDVKVIGIALTNDNICKIQIETDGSPIMEREPVFEPIPITEEWLRRFWFSMRGGYSYYPNKEIDSFHQITFKDNKIELECEDSWYTIDFPFIKYIHQLQNLFFSLTGQELTQSQLTK